MTGLERNADLVHQATYAPLFAHVEGWQWRPDLIWFDNLTSVRSANWYVQALYGNNAGTNVLSITEDGKALTGQNGLYASACYDKPTKDYIVKVGNNSDKPQQLIISFKGIKNLGAGKATLLHSDNLLQENTINNKYAVVPVTTDIKADGNTLTITIPAKSFVVYRF